MYVDMAEDALVPLLWIQDLSELADIRFEERGYGRQQIDTFAITVSCTWFSRPAYNAGHLWTSTEDGQHLRVNT